MGTGEHRWDENAEARVNELHQFIQHYGGEIVSGLISDPARQQEVGMVFPDCVQVRVRMNGAGFRDVILNFAHLFDVVLPPELQQPRTESLGHQVEPQLVVHPPAASAPTVCVIDSGIQEGHRWLEPAIDSETSRAFSLVSPQTMWPITLPRKDTAHGSLARFCIQEQSPPPVKSNRLRGFKTPAFSMPTTNCPTALHAGRISPAGCRALSCRAALHEDFQSFNQRRCAMPKATHDFMGRQVGSTFARTGSTVHPVGG